MEKVIDVNVKEFNAKDSVHCKILFFSEFRK